MVFRGYMLIYKVYSHYGIQVSLILPGIPGWLGGASWKHMECVCLFFGGMLLIERKFIYCCGCCSFANAAADNDRSSAGSFPLLAHTAAGTDWGNRAEQMSTEGPSHASGSAVCSAAVHVKQMWMREEVSLHQSGAAAQVITGQSWAPTSRSRNAIGDKEACGRKCDPEGRLEKRGEKRLQLGCEAV